MCKYLPLRQDLYARREIEFRRSQNSRYSSPVNNFSLIQARSEKQTPKLRDD